MAEVALGIVEGLRRGLNYARQGQSELARTQIQLARLAMERRQLEMKEEADKEARKLRQQQQKLYQMQEERLQKVASLAEKKWEMERAEQESKLGLMNQQRQDLQSAFPGTQTGAGTLAPQNQVGMTPSQMEYYKKYHPGEYLRLMASQQQKPASLTEVQGGTLAGLVSQYGPEEGLKRYYEAQREPRAPSTQSQLQSYRQQLLGLYGDKWSPDEQVRFLSTGKPPEKDMPAFDELRAKAALAWINEKDPQKKQQKYGEYAALSWAGGADTGTSASPLKPKSLLDQKRERELVADGAALLFNSLAKGGWDISRAKGSLASALNKRPTTMDEGTWRLALWNALQAQIEGVQGKPAGEVMDDEKYARLAEAVLGKNPIDVLTRIASDISMPAMPGAMPQMPGVQAADAPAQTPQVLSQAAPQGPLPTPTPFIQNFPAPAAPENILSQFAVPMPGAMPPKMGAGAGQPPVGQVPVPPMTQVEAGAPQQADLLPAPQQAAPEKPLGVVPAEEMKVRQQFYNPRQWPTTAVALKATGKKRMGKKDVQRVLRGFFADVKLRKLSDAEWKPFFEQLQAMLSDMATAVPTK